MHIVVRGDPEHICDVCGFTIGAGDPWCGDRLGQLPDVSLCFCCEQYFKVSCCNSCHQVQPQSETFPPSGSGTLIPCFVCRGQQRTPKDAAWLGRLEDAIHIVRRLRSDWLATYDGPFVTQDRYDWLLERGSATAAQIAQFRQRDRELMERYGHNLR